MENDDEIILLIEEDSIITKPVFDCSSEVENYKCYKCSYETQLFKCMKRHIQEGHTAQIEQSLLYKCGSCSFESFSKYLCAKHTQFDCTVNREGASAAALSDCPSCPHQNSHSSETLKHANIPQNRRLQYDKRPSRFSIKQDPPLHQNKHNVPMKCPQCNFCTFHKTSLHRHEANKHQSGIEFRKYECKLCPFQTNYKTSMDRHREQHFAPLFGEKKFQCKQCPSKFRVQEHLEKHEKWIHAAPGSEEWKKSERCKLTSMEVSRL